MNEYLLRLAGAISADKVYPALFADEHKKAAHEILKALKGFKVHDAALVLLHVEQSLNTAVL